MYLKCQYTDGRALRVDVYPTFLTVALANLWFNYLQPLFPETKGRDTLLFGDSGLVYTTVYRGGTTHRPVYPWSELSSLFELKTLVEAVTNQKYTVCVIQYYPNGKVGIGAHRDKEMVPGTRICGLSLGATRTIVFNPAYSDIPTPTAIALPSGSLYVMNPPTNQKYTHAILKDTTITTPRISLTFRDYAPPQY